MAISTYIKFILAIMIIFSLYDTTTAFSAAIAKYQHSDNFPEAEKEAIGWLLFKSFVWFGVRFLVVMATGGSNAKPKPKQDLDKDAVMAAEVVSAVDVEEGGELEVKSEETSVVTKESEENMGVGKTINVDVTPMDDKTVVWPVVCSEGVDGVRTCSVAAHGNVMVKLTIDGGREV
jgi:hypothetical protein